MVKLENRQGDSPLENTLFPLLQKVDTKL